MRLSLLLLLFFIALLLSLEGRDGKMEHVENLSITIVYDNVAFNNFTASHGFACLLEVNGRRILFDTGGDGKILLSNMKKLGIEPSSISAVFLSHEHYDHVGGLASILQRNGNVTVYLLASFPKELKDFVKAKGAKVVEVVGPLKLSDGVYSTGGLGSMIKEQALVINTKRGAVVITGCAHPGIDNIVKFVVERFNKKIYLVVGGFHLMGQSKQVVENVAKNLVELKVAKVMPCHCSGKLAVEIFSKLYGKNFETCGVGKVLKIKEV